jgi:hypothetical protein
MFDFVGSPVPVRHEVAYAHRSLWHHIAGPGPTLTGEERVSVLAGARADDPTATGSGAELGQLAVELYHRPTHVDGDVVRAAVDADGDPTTVEVLALISMLSAVDGTHRGLGIDLEPLPEPVAGLPTGRITEGLKRRRTHIPVPPGPIPVVFDLLPMEGAVFQSLFGPHYMTGWEMALDGFRRTPGLDRAQMELVSSRTSIHNECFY